MSKTLEVRGLRKVYQDPGRSVEALRDLTFSVAASELVCVVGPSGCGKTTLLRCAAGLLEPTAGEVLLEGARVTGPPPDLAVVFQEYGRSLFPWMTVRANVELPLRSKGLGDDHRRRLVGDALAAVGLPGVRDQLTTRSDPRFTQLRGHVYAQIQQAQRRDYAPS
jgi:NitT/TauT family transport system ATP-binding protein